jgi:ubiquinone/menaquinone biosynthesis C-methylase UbiE
MATAEWGAHPEFFGPRHAHRERRIVRALERRAPGPGLHLECAAGVGSLALELARRRRPVVAADRSLRSLAHLHRRANVAEPVLTVVADINALPFADATFTSATSAETLEHLTDDVGAVRELGRTLRPGGWLVGTVPSNPHQRSEWDDWAGHLRRYESGPLATLLGEVGPGPVVTNWGWPLVRLYDALFLRTVIRRRHRSAVPLERDTMLSRIAGLGRRRGLVRAMSAVFELDRLFDGVRWGVGLLFAVQKPG